MDIHHATLETCSAATDTVVVIDVWRSFTTLMADLDCCLTQDRFDFAMLVQR
jgi:hypothetical protein